MWYFVQSTQSPWVAFFDFHLYGIIDSKHFLSRSACVQVILGIRNHTFNNDVVWVYFKGDHPVVWKFCSSEIKFSSPKWYLP